jgi:hypothetical protein
MKTKMLTSGIRSIHMTNHVVPMHICSTGSILPLPVVRMGHEEQGY